VGGSKAMPTTFAPSFTSQAVSQDPLNPVCPVINTVLSLKLNIILVPRLLTTTNLAYLNFEIHELTYKSFWHNFVISIMSLLVMKVNAP
jgi:hypothetical protein